MIEVSVCVEKYSCGENHLYINNKILCAFINITIHLIP